MTTTRLRLIAASCTMLLCFAASAQEVRDREANQQQRIGQGLASGQVTANEAARIEHRESRINASRRADLASNGSHLTAGEYRQ